MVPQELKLSDQLFGLYVDVLETLAEWKHVSPCQRPSRPKAAPLGRLKAGLNSFSIKRSALPYSVTCFFS